MSNSLERLTEALARAQRHWRERTQEAVASALTIAMTRETGTSGPSVAHEMGSRLGWPVYDHELLEHIAQEMGQRVSLLESMDEKRQSWLRESLEAFASVPSVSESAYVSHLIETILSLGAHGKCLIVGRGAAQILPAETTLRVRLVAPLEHRITVISQRFGLSRSEAARQVQATDRERIRFIKDHFLKDPTNLHQYDLVLNTSRWSVAEAADLIIEGLRRLQKHAGRDS
jgi:cytidylate kinase